jgi:hypothetical protein
VNEDLIKEADFFRDIVIVPFADSYDLVVLKTVAICDYVVCSTRVDKHIIRVFQVHFVRVFMHMLPRFFHVMLLFELSRLVLFRQSTS